MRHKKVSKLKKMVIGKFSLDSKCKLDFFLCQTQIHEYAPMCTASSKHHRSPNVCKKHAANIDNNGTSSDMLATVSPCHLALTGLYSSQK